MLKKKKGRSTHKTRQYIDWCERCYQGLAWTFPVFLHHHPTQAMWIPLTRRHAEYLPPPCSGLAVMLAHVTCLHHSTGAPSSSLTGTHRGRDNESPELPGPPPWPLQLSCPETHVPPGRGRDKEDFCLGSLATVTPVSHTDPRQHWTAGADGRQEGARSSWKKSLCKTPGPSVY